MNLQQLEYIIAVDTYRHFATAAEKCHVTQPTLSMMIQKLESELDVKIFDRSKQPVMPTEAGEIVLKQARKILYEVGNLRDQINRQRNILEGHLRIGIIPTLAPYLLPLFVGQFREKYPLITLAITENQTSVLTEKLKKGMLDAGILATPLHDDQLTEEVLFYEELLAYSSVPQHDNFLSPADILPDQLWLPEEGNCLRTQIWRLCQLNDQSERQVQYEAGSLETLKALVESNEGVTILPKLASFKMPEEKQAFIRRFAPPSPAREISLVTHRDYIKRRLIDVVKQEILLVVPPDMRHRESVNVVTHI